MNTSQNLPQKTINFLEKQQSKAKKTVNNIQSKKQETKEQKNLKNLPKIPVHQKVALVSSSPYSIKEKT